jgi:WD40 repeat protein
MAICKTNNGGDYWTRQVVSTDFSSFTCFQRHPTNSDTIFLGAYSGTQYFGKIYRSTNGGTTLDEMSINVTEDWSEINCIAFDPTNTKNLFAGGNRGVYKSVNKGLNWTKLSNYFYSISAIVFDPNKPKTIYAASQYNGMYISNDYGSTWSPMNDGLNSLGIETLVLVPQKNILLAGTRGGGMYRYDLTSAVAEIKKPVLPENCALLQNYPNPFNPTTTIPYQIYESGPVGLKILNLSGQEIRTLVQQIQPAGAYSVEWNGTDNFGTPVSSGIYLYQIQTPKSVQTRKLMIIK